MLKMVKDRQDGMLSLKTDKMNQLVLGTDSGSSIVVLSKVQLPTTTVKYVYQINLQDRCIIYTVMVIVNM